MSDVERAFLTDLAHSILAIKADAKFSIEDEDADKITWYDDNPSSITKSAILAKQTELRTEYDNNEYARDRAKSYPSIADQLDDIYHNGIDAWKETIKTTKDKYPKPS